MVMNDMTDDGKWGARISVIDGKRPDWLQDEDRVWPDNQNNTPWSSDYPARRIYVWHVLPCFRLLASHPHYRQTLTAQEHLARMEALARRMAEDHKPGVHYVTQMEPLREEARALVAEMEPVDPEKVLLEETAKAIYESYEYVKPWNHPDTARIHHDHTRKAAAAAIRRGRELARGEG